MPTRVWELQGQSASGDSATRKYMFGGFASADLVLGHIQTNFAATPTPGSIATKIPYNWKSLTVQMPPEITELGGGWWEVTATYGPRRPDAVSFGEGVETETAPNHGDSGTETPIGPEISWSVIANTVPITQSLKTRQKRVRGGLGQTDARDFKGAIGVDPTTGEIKGTEKYYAVAEESLSIEIAGAVVTPAWKRLIHELTGCVNSHKFFGYEPGEVLFLGVPNLSSQSVGSTWKGQFKFAIQYNVKSRTLAEFDDEKLTVRDLHGWSHVWVTYEPKTQTIGSQTLKVTVPLEAYEEQIYEYKDLRLIGLNKRRKKEVVSS
jgi:hypothetical protein